MKKLTILLIAVLFSVSMFAQNNYTEIKSSQLPRKTTEYITKNFPGSTIKRAAKTNEKDCKYATVVAMQDRKAILVFDKDGNFLQRVRNMEELSQVTGVKAPAAKPPVANPNSKTDPPAKK